MKTRFPGLPKSWSNHRCSYSWFNWSSGTSTITININNNNNNKILSQSLSVKSTSIIHCLHLFLNTFMITTNKIMINSSSDVASYKSLIRRIPIIARLDVRQHRWQMRLTTLTILFIGWNISFERNSSERHYFPLCIAQCMLNSLKYEFQTFFCPIISHIASRILQNLAVKHEVTTIQRESVEVMFVLVFWSSKPCLATELEI